MAENYFLLKFVIILIVFWSPIERTTLKNIDLIAILDDVRKIGCWIHLAGNIGNDKDKEIQLAAQLGLMQLQYQNQQDNLGDFLVPVLLRDVKTVGEEKYRKYLSDGLSVAGRSKYSLCFINMFYWPLKIQDQNPDGFYMFDKAVHHATFQMERYTESEAFCSSFIKNGNCMRFDSSPIGAKSTVVFLEILEQGNVVLQVENKESEKKQDGNFTQPFFSALISRSSGPIFPFVAATITKSASKSTAPENQRQMELEISGVWFFNHWNILKGRINPESTCGNPSQKTKSSEKTSCYSNVISNNSKNNRNKNPGTGKSGFKTPADRFNPANFPSAVENFLKSINSNGTWKRGESYTGFKSWISKTLNVRISETTTETAEFRHSPLLWIWTGSKTYKFSTSDSVYKMKSGLQIYTTPFQKLVWALLFVSMVITVAVLLILALVQNLKETLKVSSIWKMLSGLCLWILRILLEQPDQEIPPGIQSKIHQNVIKKGLKRAIRLILGVWLMMSLILTNGYHGIIKSDYTLDFPFASEPKWNSSTDFLKDGSFFVYYTQMDWNCNEKVEHFHGFFNLTYSLWRHYQKPSFFGPEISVKRGKIWATCKSLCSLGSLYLPFEESGCQKFEPCQQFYKLELILARQCVTCTEKLSQLITTKLRHPKTVFMTTAQDFPFFWNKFKRQMKQNPELNMKFVHNRDEQDEQVQEIHGLSIDFSQSKVKPRDADFILSPLKILLSSGIVWWWEKWDQIKFHRDQQIWRNSSEFIDESLAIFKPLSFQDSDIHLVFQIWFIFLIFPATAFLLEIISMKKILRRIWLFCKQTQQKIRFRQKQRK